MVLHAVIFVIGITIGVLIGVSFGAKLRTEIKAGFDKVAGTIEQAVAKKL